MRAQVLDVIVILCAGPAGVCSEGWSMPGKGVAGWSRPCYAKGNVQVDLSMQLLVGVSGGR